MNIQKNQAPGFPNQDLDSQNRKESTNDANSEQKRDDDKFISGNSSNNPEPYHVFGAKYTPSKLFSDEHLEAAKKIVPQKDEEWEKRFGDKNIRFG